jgi:hypothetical protein
MSEMSKFKKFNFSSDGFSYKNVEYSFDDIRSLLFHKSRTTQRMNFVKVASADEAILLVGLENDKLIKLSFDETGVFFGFNRDRYNEIESLEQLYLVLAEKTFAKRMAIYTDKIETKGFFKYGGCTFSPQDQTIKYKKKTFQVKNTRFLRGPGYVLLKSKDYGIFDKIKQEVTLGSPPQFTTIMDTDVIYTLLEHYFGLRLKD